MGNGLGGQPRRPEWRSTRDRSTRGSRSRSKCAAPGTTTTCAPTRSSQARRFPSVSDVCGSLSDISTEILPAAARALPSSKVVSCQVSRVEEGVSRDHQPATQRTPATRTPAGRVAKYLRIVWQPTLWPTRIVRASVASQGPRDFASMPTHAPMSGASVSGILGVSIGAKGGTSRLRSSAQSQGYQAVCGVPPSLGTIHSRIRAF